MTTTTRRQATENTLILFQIIQEIKIITSGRYAYGCQGTYSIHT